MIKTLIIFKNKNSNNINSGIDLLTTVSCNVDYIYYLFSSFSFCVAFKASAPSQVIEYKLLPLLHSPTSLSVSN